MARKNTSDSVGPELVFGLVAAIGTDLDRVSSTLSTCLSEVGYTCDEIRLSDLLRGWDGVTELKEEPLEERYRTYMAAGTALRRRTDMGDALAIAAMRMIRETRKKIGRAVRPRIRTAYILRSLKNPEEVTTLRGTYGSGFFLIGAYAPQEQRLESLERRIADSHHSYPPQPEHRRFAEDLIRTDETEANTTLGQNVRDTFPQSDVFVNAGGTDAELRRGLERFIALVFGYPFYTPSRDEYAMFHARAAALRSAEMGRQVGAAVALPDGTIIALGTNEVPKAGGGQYWEPIDDEPDNRDFVTSEDTSDRIKRNNLSEVLEILRENRWLSVKKSKLTQSERLSTSLSLMKSTRLMNSIEFGRAVHAEMAAITDAAKRGVSLSGATLYTTTFPCHNCARHIVSTGIVRTVYIEPYAKSLAADFHASDISIEGDPSEHTKVKFEPFVGIAPRIYMNVFEMRKRKTSDGKRIEWNRGNAQPRLSPPTLDYLTLEREYAILLEKKLDGVSDTPTDQKKTSVRKRAAKMPNTKSTKSQKL